VYACGILFVCMRVYVFVCAFLCLWLKMCVCDNDVCVLLCARARLMYASSCVYDSVGGDCKDGSICLSY